MKKLWLLTLLPFFQTQNIPCTLYQCNAEQIKMNIKDEIQEVELFNIHVKDHRHLCQRLETAQTLELSYEPKANTQQVYLFADGKLIQEELLAQGEAYLKIANPTYEYGQEMIEASRHIRRTSNNAYVHFQKEPASIGIYYWLIVFGIWLFCIIFMKKQQNK